MMNGVAYYILLKSITSSSSHDSSMTDILRKQTSKGVFSLFAYVTAIGAAFLNPMISGILFVMVSVMWVMPDRNIERQLRGGGE